MTASLRSQIALPLLAAAALSLTCVTPAAAQFGGLRRAVERRVEQKAGQSAEDRVTKATLIPPTFDATTVELTAERLDRYTAAMEQRKATLAANRQRYEQMRTQSSNVREAAQKADNPKDRETYERADERYRSCRTEFVQDMERDSERQTMAMTQRMMSDPAAAQRDPKMKQIQTNMTALVQAQQAGDTATVRRLTERMANLMGTSIDSAAIDRKATPKCGARVARPRSMVVSDSLRAKADSLDSAANALMSTSGGVKGADVGLTDAQARMIWERIQSWLNGVQENAPITRTFTKQEYDLLLARRGALRKAFANSE